MKEIIYLSSAEYRDSILDKFTDRDPLDTSSQFGRRTQFDMAVILT